MYLKNVFVGILAWTFQFYLSDAWFYTFVVLWCDIHFFDVINFSFLFQITNGYFMVGSFEIRKKLKGMLKIYNIFQCYLKSNIIQTYIWF